MSWSRARWLVPLATLVMASCSVLNAFDDVAQVQQMASGGSAGAMGSGGGATSGGMGGKGGESTEEALPGLVVVGGELDGTEPGLLALSPQTGEELARLEGNYGAAVYEAERDLWFLILGDTVRAARFDRLSNSWEFESEETTIVTPVDPLHVFALNGNLAVLDTSFTTLQVFDTSDLSDIQLKGSATYPALGLWGAVGVPTNAGGEVYVQELNCNGVDPCVVQITRIQIREEVQQLTPTKIFDTSVVDPGSAHGAITFDPGVGQIVALVPDFEDDDDAKSTVFLRNRPSLTDAGSVTLQQRPLGLQPRVAVVDPCQSVLYVMGPLFSTMVAGSLNDAPDRNEMLQAVGVNGQGMVYEPYTRSLILQQSSGDLFGVHAWSITGDPANPSISKRLNTWRPPEIRPRFVSVATPRDLLCP